MISCNPTTGIMGKGEAVMFYDFSLMITIRNPF